MRTDSLMKLSGWRPLPAIALLGALTLGACEGAEDEGALETEAPVATPVAGVTGGVGDFGTLDANDDMRLTEDEFGTFWRERGLYNRWNTDNAEGLTENEFGTGIFGVWDRNEAGLTEAEWGEGTRTWFGDADVGAFGDWDANRNNLIEENEFTAGVERRGLFDTWDMNRNNLWEENEVYGGLFGAFDTDDDRALAENEWGTGWGGWDWGL